MYELGLRHTTGKLTVQIGEAGQLPFDIAMIRTIQFKRTSGGMIAARRALAEALAAGIEGRFTPTSATRIWLELPISLQELSAASLEACDEFVPEDGFLEMLANLNVARDEMIATLGAMGNVIGEIGSLTSQATDEIARAGGPSASFEQKIAISNSLAKSISGPAGRLEALATEFADSISRSDPGTKYLIEHLKGNLADSDSIISLNSLRAYFNSMLSGFDSTKSYRDSLSGKMPTKAQGIEYRRITAALDRQISTRPIVEAWIAAASE
jgi:hypothetical protein